MILMPVARKPPSEISFADLVTMVGDWHGDYLKASYDILGAKYSYLIGLGRVDQVPTLALFIKSKYTGNPGECRTFAFVLKKLDEVSGRKQRILQGGVLHGREN